jgi:hypothetical protein
MLATVRITSSSLSGGAAHRGKILIRINPSGFPER